MFFQKKAHLIIISLLILSSIIPGFFYIPWNLEKLLTLSTIILLIQFSSCFLFSIFFIKKKNHQMNSLKKTKTQQTNIKFFNKGSFVEKILRRSVSMILLLLIGIISFYLIAILFGAPLLSQFKDTFNWAYFISILSLIPLSCFYSIDDLTSIKSVLLLSYFFGRKIGLKEKEDEKKAKIEKIEKKAKIEEVEKIPKVEKIGKKKMSYSEDELVENFIFGLSSVSFIGPVIGTWISSVVYPLDWDRPWQKWPIPACFGSFFGYEVSLVLFFLFALFRFRRREDDLNKKKLK
ncbi:phosphatidylinositol-glycan biosynthesis class f protein-related [Anaeramoeba ignava]|uniref:Phosphatidylinositol-glycan biosynthesis class f protein-related n=1 Tax=Anaeramoeba ignava TaxID=1746090 RepID=A0A9Q0R6D1_ANAIG|nr:phosphatidylinositol-glycan biosynthesis class f protein-related [Anaeramoeba ignava]